MKWGVWDKEWGEVVKVRIERRILLIKESKESRLGSVDLEDFHEELVVLSGR
ncbi:hypothetical protein [Neisseria sicca]|uniref:hypothetical protein n=1 Tax=Neisseria sicca TaxID=490 RepID=UPI001649B6B4|nr:hypothetical protein [Neisseria sicca]